MRPPSNKFMPIFDVILLIVLFGFIFYGLFFGFIRTLGGFIGIFIGAFLASRFYLSVWQWAEHWFIGYDNLGKILVFFILFSLISKLTSFVFFFADRAFNIISIIPFLKTINKLLGALLGFLTGALFIGLFLYIASRYTLIEGWLGNWLVGSQTAPFFLKFANFLVPFLPEVLKKIQSII